MLAERYADIPTGAVVYYDASLFIIDGTLENEYLKCFDTTNMATGGLDMCRRK